MAEQRPTKQRPYLIRAMHEWMVDNGLTPHIVADAAADGLRIPREYVKDGKIVLNVGYSATRALVLGNDEIVFEARFGGVPQQISVPVAAVLGIYARENGQGMIFSGEDPESPPAGPDGPEGGGSGGTRPKLTVVK
jgi:stringent starvation protein B